MKTKNKLKKRLFFIIIILIIIIISLFTILAYTLNTSESPKGESCLSLTFDDGLQSHYTTVYPLLKQKNFGATFFIISNLTEFEGHKLLNISQIKEIQEDGFEIGSHTLHHPYLTELTQEQLTNEIQLSKQILESKNLTITSLAIPYRDYNQEILKQSNLYYEIVRDNHNFNSGGFLFNANAVYQLTDVDKICEKIKTAKEKNKWLILIFHDVSGNPGYWDISIKDFNYLLDCAEEAGIKVDSLKNCQETTGSFNTLKFPLPKLKPKPIGF